MIVVVVSILVAVYLSGRKLPVKYRRKKKEFKTVQRYLNFDLNYLNANIHTHTQIYLPKFINLYAC